MNQAAFDSIMQQVRQNNTSGRVNEDGWAVAVSVVRGAFSEDRWVYGMFEIGNPQNHTNDSDHPSKTPEDAARKALTELGRLLKINVPASRPARLPSLLQGLHTSQGCARSAGRTYVGQGS